MKVAKLVFVFRSALLGMFLFHALALTASGAQNPTVGELTLSVMSRNNNVQRSNYSSHSFELRNSGDKTIVAFELDVSGCLFPDSVFDPEGIAGDSVAKPIRIDRDEKTGVMRPKGVTSMNYVGAGGTSGYSIIRLAFDPMVNDGFNAGEMLSFSVDMDPNSIAGTEKKPLDNGSIPRWDVGGVSGAEIIGSRFTVVFEDGSKAYGQLFGTKTQAGAHGKASVAPALLLADLRVNGLKPGEIGTYSHPGPDVWVRGPRGKTIRVILAKGFIQPVTAYNNTLRSQLEALANEPFPANNAVEFQTVDVIMTGEAMNLNGHFDFTQVTQFDFQQTDDSQFSVDEDKLPLAFVAAVIESGNLQLPLGPVTKPVYLTYTPGN